MLAGHFSLRRNCRKQDAQDAHRDAREHVMYITKEMSYRVFVVDHIHLLPSHGH
jgi:hypothetical protein